MENENTIFVKNYRRNMAELVELHRDNLIELSEIYLASNGVRSETSNIRIIRSDLHIFFEFYQKKHGNLDPKFWSKSITIKFKKFLSNKITGHNCQATIYRIYVTVRRFARWLSKYPEPFLMGCPTNGIKPPREPIGQWRFHTHTPQKKSTSVFESDQ